MNADPIEPPNPHRPLPEIWDGDLIIWENWEQESDLPGFVCNRLDPWVREEFEALFTPAPAPTAESAPAAIPASKPLQLTPGLQELLPARA